MMERNALDPNDPRAQTRATMVRVGLLAAVALLIASTVPPAFVAGTLSTVLLFAALGAAIAAVFLGERPTGHDHLTRWDEAAMLFLMSLIAGGFADPEAMQAALQEMQHQQTAAAGADRAARSV